MQAADGFGADTSPESAPPRGGAGGARRVRMTSQDVGLVAPDAESPDRRTAVRMMFSGPERRRRRAAVLPEAQHRSRSERRALGREARADVPRSRHAELELGADRTAPYAILIDQDAERIAEQIPVRWSRMLASEYAFFRGAGAVMAADLQRTPTTGLSVQLCGDAHLSNFGLFAVPDGGAVFDIAAFDATLPGPWEWDLKRLATSVEIAGRDGGLPARTRRPLVTRVVRAYREAMIGFAARDNLRVWFDRVDGEGVLADARGQVARRAAVPAPAGIVPSGWSSGVRIVSVDDEPRLAADPRVAVPLSGPEDDDEVAWAHRQLQTYRRSLPPERRYLLEQYRFADVARVVDGIAPAGLHRYLMLLVGSDADDVLVLQMTEAQPSLLERHLGASAYLNNGERVVIGQRRLQAAGDMFLGWQRIDDGPDETMRDFYWRQRRACLGTIDIDGFHPAMLGTYADLCGWTLARGHARSGDRVALASYMGKGAVLDEAIADFAIVYADQNARDFAAVAAAVRDDVGTADAARV